MSPAASAVPCVRSRHHAGLLIAFIPSVGFCIGSFVRKATLSSDGKTLELTSKTTFSRDGQETTLNSSDKLSLSADGKTLTVVRHAETPRGVQDSTLVFTK